MTPGSIPAWDICCVFWPANRCFAGCLLFFLFEYFNSVKEQLSNPYSSILCLGLGPYCSQPAKRARVIRSNICSIRPTLRLIWWLSTNMLTLCLIFKLLYYNKISWLLLKDISTTLKSKLFSYLSIWKESKLVIIIVQIFRILFDLLRSSICMRIYCCM